MYSSISLDLGSRCRSAVIFTLLLLYPRSEKLRYRLDRCLEARWAPNWYPKRGRQSRNCKRTSLQNGTYRAKKVQTRFRHLSSNSAVILLYWGINKANQTTYQYTITTIKIITYKKVSILPLIIKRGHSSSQSIYKCYKQFNEPCISILTASVV
jgi:hypothetical protein